MRPSSALFATLAFVGAAAAGCATADQANEALIAGDVLVAIPRDVDASTVATRDAVLQSRSLAQSADRNEDFYLAVRRNTLDQPWFLTFYIKELSPFGPNPATLGTKV